MSSRDLNDVNSDDKLSEQERLRREIAEYEALLEDELKPISPSFLKGEKEEPGIKAPTTSTKEVPSKEISSSGLISMAEELVADKPPVSEVKPRPLPKNKEDVLMEIAEQDTQLIKEEEVFPAKPEDEETRLFHQLVQNYLPKSLSVEINDLIEATVVAVSSKYVLVDLGGKAEVVIDIDELADEKGDINVHVGDRIKVLVTGWDEESEQVIVSHQLAKQKEALNLIQRAYAEH
ncbi:MAG: S1 RNA-binding domain-containing protein, partial [Candidatus Sumerlaeia bacterium]|nr:S1 RNA-binding domain-containing protein [Candidatus Sumerlaeia bacterium]